MLAEYMKQLQEEMQIAGDFSTEPPGTFVLPLGENVAVKLSPLNQGFYLSSSIAPCPQVKKEAFLGYLLQGNLFGQGTKDAILGTSEDGNLLTLSKAVEYTVDYKKFKDILEDFINNVDFWREEALRHK